MPVTSKTSYAASLMIAVRVVVLVHPVTEAHQASLAGLDAFDEGGNVVEAADVVEHVEHRLVGAAMARAVEGGSGSGNRAVRVGVGGSDHSCGRGGAVLLVIGVENQEDFHRLVQRRVDLVGLPTWNIMFRKFEG